VARATRIPHRQGIVKLQTHFRAILLRVKREVFLERGVEEEGRPFCQWGASDRWAGGVGLEEGSWEEVVLGDIW